MTEETALLEAPLLEAVSLSKRFGDFTAVDDVSLAIRPGEVHALLGENGAGKSTLVKMLYGILEPSAGEILWVGKPTRIARPSEARAMGIGMVFQHFSVFDALTVAENIALALPNMPMAALAARIREVSTAYGLGVEPDRAVHTLSVGEKQRVEIIRSLLQEPKLLIMDEPTSVLTPQEAEVLFETLRRLAGQGCAILYISHRLDEVRALCERATILRRGKLVGSCDPSDVSAREIAEMMVGTRIGWTDRSAAPTPGEVRLAVRDLSVPAPSDFAVALKGISFDLHAGEVMGIAGIAGEGQPELMAALIGETRTRADAIQIDGKPLGDRGPTARRMAGAAFVPEERNGHAAVSDMRLSENTVLSLHRPGGISRGGWLSFARAATWAERIRRAFDVRSGAPDPAASALSGGNLQKFVVGREILRDPGVLVVSQPTWGVDAGAAAVIRQALVDLARSGAAILVISQDLDEIFEISDRIAVIHKGHLSAPAPAVDMSPDKIGLLMGGAFTEAA
ncbi:MAG: ABC transporter ATP-binding protein [Pseudomonadota bacterium]